MKFTSEFFDDVEDLVNEKNNRRLENLNRRDREKIVRSFYNGQPTMTKAEEEEEGKEVTNHLMGHKAIAKLESRLYRIYAGSREFFDVKVDTDNPEVDLNWSTKISKALSDATRHSGLLSALWRSCAGELNLTGRVPLIHESEKGWCPTFAPNILLPKGSPIVASEVTYLFNPKEMTMVDLKRLKKVSAGKGGLIDGEAIDELITLLKEQVELNSKTAGSTDAATGHEHESSVTDCVADRKTTVNVWWYYEISPEKGVSGTLFTETMTYVSGKETKSLNAKIVGHIPSLFKNVERWLQLMVLDSEIGGVKTYDSTKGIAELSYNSDLDVEELLNTMIEGDKSRAIPRFQEEEGANPDATLDWNPNDDSVVPSGIKEFRLNSSSNALLTPFGILSNNSAGLTGDATSNTGKEQQLRVQAVQSESIASEMERTRMEDVYMSLDLMLSEIAYRFMVESQPKSAKGYNDVAWFLDEMEEAGIPVKELGERKNGRFKHITVRARRLSGGGQMDKDIAASQMMLQNISAYPPESRPIILHRATATLTEDPDFADYVVKTPEVIINQQRAIAENEFQTMMGRGALGEPLPINPTDIDPNHIDSHMIDMQAKLMEHEIRPWDAVTARGFQANSQHVNAHVQRMLSVTTSNKEAEQYLQPLQQMNAMADQIIAELQEQQQQQQEGGTPMTQKEKADTQLKAQDSARKDEELQLKKVDLAGTQQQRNSRTEIAERNQRLKEIGASAKITKEAIQLQQSAQPTPQIHQGR